jgi:hypothetical protein
LKKRGWWGELSKIHIRLKTNWRMDGLPVPRPNCPVCSTLDRIQTDGWNRDRPGTSRIRRGGTRGSCGTCQTEFSIITRKIGKFAIQHKYIPIKFNKIVRDKLANYWIAHRKGKLPKILEVGKK